MKLFEPCRIGKLELRNRLVMGPMSLNSSKDGFVAERMIRFLEERAKGGVGLIMLGDGIVDFPIGNNVAESVAIDEDKYVPVLRELNQRVRRHDARTCIQLSHGGRRAGQLGKSGYLEVSGGKIPVAPSVVAHPVPGHVVPKELTIDDIEDIIEEFGQATRRALDSGFDSIGLHCAHMYLCGQFLSPWANKRQDNYGGDLERRLTFVLRVIARMRQEMGDDYPLIVRMNGQETEGGNTYEEIKQIAQRIEKAGADALSISVGIGRVAKDYFLPGVGPMRDPDAGMVHLADGIKKHVAIPVMTVNKIRHTMMAQEILDAGKADFIIMGRPLIADPELPMKSAEGKFDEIIPCIFCNRCGQSARIEPHASCSVNPVAFREGEITIEPASVPKNVVVIGGGPAGLEAAIVAASRGHKVVIYEKEAQLGGQLLIAVKPPGKANITDFINYLRNEVKRLGIKVVPGSEATAKDIEKLRPDVVIIATGGTPVIPPIPGIAGKDVVTAWQVLAGSVATGQKVVIIGGGQVGMETAEYLAEQGKSVTVVEMLNDVATGMPDVDRLSLLISLERLGVSVMTMTSAESVTDGTVTVSRKGKARQLPADTVVLAAGLKPNRGVADSLKGKVPEIFVIGDSSEPGRILEAIRDGFEIANKI
ncbi:FAD-dependent oxidoreductase [Chloroflexota bacterium]